jgi:hypothetical protein
VTDSERIAYEVPAPLVDRLEALRGIIPEAFTEDVVDFDKLRAAIGDELDDSPERYSFTWAGKRAAIRLLQAPSRATLAPAIDPLVDGWQGEDVLWEIAIKEGYALHSRVEQLDDVAQNTVWRVTDPDKQQSFLICLDHEVQETSVAALRLSADDLFICRDVALSDTPAANLALQCRLKTI